MIKKLLVAIALLLLSSFVYAEDFYIAQSAAGEGNGTSCANAYALTFFDAGANWSASLDSPGDIGPGDTVYLCGDCDPSALTWNKLLFLQSGLEGNPITLKWYDGAKATRPAGCVIALNGKDYITLDGGTNGIVENSANGDALANQTTLLGLGGIGITSSDYVEIKNLRIQNLYVRYGHGCTKITSSSRDTYEGIYGNPVGTSVWVHDNVFDMVSAGMNASGAGADFRFYNNTLTNYDHGLTGPNATTLGSYIYNNSFGTTEVWDNSLFTVTDISNANPGVVTYTGATTLPMETGWTQCFYNVGGMTELDHNCYTITVIDSTHFSINADTTTFGEFTGRASPAAATLEMGNMWHHDGIHIYNTTAPSDTITNVNIYNNSFTGDWGYYVTAPMFLECSRDYIDGCNTFNIFNNYINITSSGTPNPLITALVDNVSIMGNTIIGDAQSGVAVSIVGNVNVLKNNLISGVKQFVILDNAATLDAGSLSNNLYVSGTASAYSLWCWSGTLGLCDAGSGSNTFSAWQTATSQDTSPSAYTTDAQTNADGTLLATSSAINNGADLSGLSITALNSDIDGNARSDWDIGAYEYDPPPTISSFTVDPSGAFVTIRGSENLAVTTGAGYTLSSDGDAVTLTHTSISGTDIIQATSRTILSTEALTYSYTGTDTKDLSGNELAAITDEAVANSSTQSGAVVSETAFGATGQTAFSGGGSTVWN